MKNSLNHNEILKNRAVIKGSAECRCDNCGENLVFAMQDKHHKFSIGIEDVLICLRIAEENGAVPKLPKDWWVDIITRYDGVRS